MQRSRMISGLFVAVVVAIGCGGGKPQDAGATTDAANSPKSTVQPTPTPATGQTTARRGSSSVKGTVRLVGTPPAPVKIKMDADPVCQQQHPTPFYGEEVVVNDQGMLKNVFVYVKGGLTGTFPSPETPVTIDQAGCWYQPHVLGIQVNQPLEIVNSDPTDHNINAISPTTSRTLFNVSQPSAGVKKITKKFTKPEVMVRLKCNVHPWMGAYAGILEHPFYSVSGADGGFAISGLPAGTYTLEAWHEKYGTQTQSVTVADGESKSIEFTFKTQ